VFAKRRGKDRQDNLKLNLEEFISIKGVSALGNQLTKEKVLEINAMEALPYEMPEAIPVDDLEVVDEENVTSEEIKTEEPKPKEETTTKEKEVAKKQPKEKPSEDKKDVDPDTGEEGQTSLF